MPRILQTNRLRVQFKKRLSDKMLTAFAKRHDLYSEGHDAFSDMLASFTVEGNSEGLIAKVEAEPLVERAWHPSLTQYKRNP